MAVDAHTDWDSSPADACFRLPRLIESSLGSVATKLNFFIHNLAQMKFASSEERPVLSFAPRVHTLKSDGLIRNLFVLNHVKTYSPNKGYVRPLCRSPVHGKELSKASKVFCTD